MANIGMMEGAYFVGRVELLNWLNDLLKLDYTKVEQTASAAAHCQVIDSIYPGQIPLSKVNFNAMHEYEFVKNFKVLQNAFDKLGIDKHIDVNKLVKAKYQDNLEFLQWIKRYWDLNKKSDDYNAIERRKAAYAGDKKYLASGGATTFKQGATPSNPPASNTGPKKVEAAPKKTVSAAPKVSTGAARVSTGVTKTAAAKASPAPSAAHAEVDDSKVQELKASVAELKLTVDGLEKERDFYFGKLREIEILCQASDQSSEAVQNVLKILYATEDTEGFVAEESAAPQEAPAADDEETY